MIHYGDRTYILHVTLAFCKAAANVPRSRAWAQVLRIEMLILLGTASLSMRLSLRDLLRNGQLFDCVWQGQQTSIAHNRYSCLH